ncbi:hypothetical protein Pmani_033676, partial [Petrolisthes manimaculis]
MEGRGEKLERREEKGKVEETMGEGKNWKKREKWMRENRITREGKKI